MSRHVLARTRLKRQASELLRAIMVVRTLVPVDGKVEAAREVVDENLVKALRLADDIRTTLWSRHPIDNARLKP